MMMMLFGSFRIYLFVCIERQRRRQSVATKLTLEASLGSTISSGSGAYGGQLVAGLPLAGNGVCLIKCTPFPKNRTTLAFSRTIYIGPTILLTSVKLFPMHLEFTSPAMHQEPSE